MTETTSKEAAKPTSPGEKGVAVYEPNTHPMASFRGEIERLFDDFFPDFSFGPFRRRAVEPTPARRVTPWLAMPSVDVKESDTDFEIEVDLPGMDETDVELSCRNGVLSLKGERHEETTDKDIHVSERRHGTFERSFRLPESVDEDKISAVFSKGVLTIKLLKKKEAQHPSRTIKIKAA